MSRQNVIVPVRIRNFCGIDIKLLTVATSMIAPGANHSLSTVIQKLRIVEDDMRAYAMLCPEAFKSVRKARKMLEEIHKQSKV